MHKLYEFLNGIANKRTFIALICASVVCVALFQLRERWLGKEAGRSLDGRINYCVDDAEEYLDKIGPKGRVIYAVTQLTLDLAYPIIYTTFFATAIVALFKRETAVWLLPLPVLAGSADIVENILTSLMALTLNVHQLVDWASAFTGTKWILISVTVLIVTTKWIARLFKSR